MPECGAPAIAQTADKAGGRVPLVTEELLPFCLCVLPTRVHTYANLSPYTSRVES